METSNEINEIGLALSQAQGEIENAKKNATNPHFKSDYADLASVLDVVRPVFSKYGLAVLQAPSFDGSKPLLTTIIIHKSGQWIKSELSCLSAKNDAQGIGSAITYLRRYSLAAFAGIGQEDDDGESVKIEKKPVEKKQDDKKEVVKDYAYFSDKVSKFTKEFLHTINKDRPDCANFKIAVEQIKESNLTDEQKETLILELERKLKQ